MSTCCRSIRASAAIGPTRTRFAPSRRLIERFRLVPGVTAVGASKMVPLVSGSLGLGGLRAPGYTGPEGDDAVDADWDAVTPGYFAAHASAAHARPGVHGTRS